MHVFYDPRVLLHDSVKIAISQWQVVPADFIAAHLSLIFAEIAVVESGSRAKMKETCGLTREDFRLSD